jgi:hypothetical protein
MCLNAGGCGFTNQGMGQSDVRRRIAGTNGGSSMRRGPHWAGEGCAGALCYADGMPSLDLVPDEEVERLAKKHGPGSVAAEVWAELSAQRAKDRQVFAFRCGDWWITGPVPDIHAEADLVEWVDEDEEE